MAFVKHEGTIDTMDKFLVEIKNYLLQSRMFGNAVDFESLEFDRWLPQHYGFSVKHKDGKWFNFGRKFDVENILSISISRDGKANRNFDKAFRTINSAWYPATTECGKYLFPFVNLYVTTTKTFVAFSAEIKKGQFVHFIVGKHLSHEKTIEGVDGDVGGEFVYITFMPDGTGGKSDEDNIKAWFSGYDYSQRPNRYEMCRTVLHDGIPSKNYEGRDQYQQWATFYKNLSPCWVIYYGLSCPLNITIKSGLIEMYDVQHASIRHGSSRFNGRTTMNPHKLRLNVTERLDPVSLRAVAVDPAEAIRDAKNNFKIDEGKDDATALAKATAIVKDSEVFYNNELCTLAIEDIEPATQIGDWVIFPLVTKNRDGVFSKLWSSHIGVGFKFK